MFSGLRAAVLPEAQRRTLEELTDDLDLRSGDRRSKQSAFWTMLVLSGVIATAGILADSTATVIGAMIIAPLSTPIMGIALGIVKRQRTGAALFVLAGAGAVVLIGVAAAVLLPGTVDLQTNSQVTARTSPTVVDLVAAVATGIAGAVGLSRRDVAAVLPGVAIAISLVPPLAVAGVCLGEGSVTQFLGALLLFVSNLVALVLAGTMIFAALGYAEDADAGARAVGAERRTSLTLAVLVVAVLVPLGLNTAAVLLLHGWTQAIERVSGGWAARIPGAEVTEVQYSSNTFRITLRTPDAVTSTDGLLDAVEAVVPSGFAVLLDTTYGEEIELGTTGAQRASPANRPSGRDSHP